MQKSDLTICSSTHHGMQFWSTNHCICSISKYFMLIGSWPHTLRCQKSRTAKQHWLCLTKFAEKNKIKYISSLFVYFQSLFSKTPLLISSHISLLSWYHFISRKENSSFRLVGNFTLMTFFKSYSWYTFLTKSLTP